MLYLLRPTYEGKKFIRFECTNGFLIRADSSGKARFIAQNRSKGDEVVVTDKFDSEGKPVVRPFWLDSYFSSCEELENDGEEGVLLLHFIREKRI